MAQVNMYDTHATHTRKPMARRLNTREIFTHVILGQSLPLLQVHYDGGSGEHLKLRPANEEASQVVSRRRQTYSGKTHD